MAKKRRKKSIPSKLPFILISFGLALLTLWGIHRYFYTRSMSLSDVILASFARQAPAGALPVHIAIGTHISLPVVEAGKVDGAWAISQTSANFVHGSATPGTVGNIIIYAHNSDALFGKLDKAKIGDTITIRTTDGELHRYIVASVSWVTPGHTELLAPSKVETLTLYTCAGILDSLRIVVRAVPAP